MLSTPVICSDHLPHLVSDPPSCYATLDFADSRLLDLFATGLCKLIKQSDKLVFRFSQLELMRSSAHVTIPQQQRTID